MEAILSDLSEKYSVIIIDAPPVNVVTDAMELANKVSGIIMVTRYGKTTTDDIDNAMSKIEFAKMNMLGFILNDIKVGRGGKYYSKYKYDKNYGYGSSHSADSDDEEEKPVEKKSADKDSAKKKKGGK
jgi:Mrp family chromosome partitioning ATPase